MSYLSGLRTAFNFGQPSGGHIPAVGVAKHEWLCKKSCTSIFLLCKLVVQVVSAWRRCLGFATGVPGLKPPGILHPSVASDTQLSASPTLLCTYLLHATLFAVHAHVYVTFPQNCARLLKWTISITTQYNILDRTSAGLETLLSFQGKRWKLDYIHRLESYIALQLPISSRQKAKELEPVYSQFKVLLLFSKRSSRKPRVNPSVD